GVGTLVLTERSTYTGDTRIEAGAIELGDGLGASDVVIGAQGTLRGRGSIAGDVRNGGHLVVSSAGDATGLSVDGDYVQEAPGTLNLLGVRTGYTASAHENILHAGGGVSGTFSQLTSVGNFLDATLAYDPDDVFLDITRLDVAQAAQAMGLTPVSQSGAALVEQ